MNDTDAHPKEVPTTTKRARVARDSESPSFSTIQGQPGILEQTATCCKDVTSAPAQGSGAKGELAQSTLQIHIGHPSEPTTLPAGTPLQNPAASLSTQSRDSQRISCSDDTTLKKPPPPPPRPPPISSVSVRLGIRLGSVSSMSFFSPTQSLSEMTKVSDAPVRSRSAQRTSPQTPRKRLGSGPQMSILSPLQSASQLSSGRSSSAQRAGPRSGNSAAGDGLFGRCSSFSSDA